MLTFDQYTRRHQESDPSAAKLGTYTDRNRRKRQRKELLDEVERAASAAQSSRPSSSTRQLIEIQPHPCTADLTGVNMRTIRFDHVMSLKLSSEVIRDIDDELTELDHLGVKSRSAFIRVATAYALYALKEERLESAALDV